jgi:hypothetical protein
MADRFIAINIGTGDAFFLERDGFTVLVDGGLDTGFPHRFMQATGRDGVDVLVCTHNDQDHANGIVEFIEYGLGAREVWLPATWLEALADMLTKPEDVLFDVFVKEEEEQRTKGAGGAEAPEARTKPRRDGPEVTADEIDRLLDRAADLDPRYDRVGPPWASGPYVIIHSGRRILVHGFPSAGGQGASAVDVLLSAANIRKIAIAATRKNIRIRWFDPEHVPAAHAPVGPLRVVSATEARSIRRTALSPRDVLRLTQINRDSLVLHSPASPAAPDVFFCADSGLDFGGAFPGGPGMIVTSPHHGSNNRENVAAYGRLAAAHGAAVATSWTWVRSDKRFAGGGSRPCAEYLQQPLRFCTNCRGTTQSQDVVFHGGGNAWSPDAAAKRCACTTP